LELFFLTNLLVFAAVSAYATQFSKSKVKNQQGLAVAMVGSVLVVSCGILGYQSLYIFTQYKVIRKRIGVILANFKVKDKAGKSQLPIQNQKQLNISTTTTCSIVELEERVMPTNELREPLLTYES
jgi:hypothetical protein